jgi:hypothetical protein
MTLPFRRRHHDDETSHDRARALTSAEMVEPLAVEEAGWLSKHLDSCVECRRDRDAFIADRELLRGLRERTPEPPRDLWARTSAAIDRESRTRRARGSSASRGWRGLPFGAAAGALIVLVVIGVSVFPRITSPSSTPGNSQVAIVSADPQPTTFYITAGQVAFIRAAANGSWEFVTADIDAVCPRARPTCQQLVEDNPGRPVDVSGTPTGMTISPNEKQLVVSARAAGAKPDRILVVPVPSASPVVTPIPTDSGPTDAPPTDAPPTDAPPTDPASTDPASTEPASPEPSAAVPDGILEIASGVLIVGEAAYSPNGMWLAFSARPSDNSTGPDLYLWTVGEPTAVAITTDHRTYFSSWLGEQVLASRVDEPGPVLATDEPEVTPDVDATEAPASAAHPSSFLLDPETLSRTEIASPDVWLPVVDPTGRFVAYWSGTLTPTADGLDWQLGTGHLVLDGWSNGPDALASAEPSADPTATAAPALGPSGTPASIVDGEIAVFKAQFDPSGTRLAVWIGEQLDADVGRLHLIVLDSITGAVDSGPEPLPGEPALRRFSIAEGRVAWVSPSGQDGQESAVQVLGWSSTQFGEIRTISAKALYIVR